MKSFLSALLLLSSTLALADIPVEPKVAWTHKSVRVCFGNELQRKYTFALHDEDNFVEYTRDQKNGLKKSSLKNTN
jgi:hypothetical protein